MINENNVRIGDDQPARGPVVVGGPAVGVLVGPSRTGRRRLVMAAPVQSACGRASFRRHLNPEYRFFKSCFILQTLFRIHPVFTLYDTLFTFNDTLFNIAGLSMME